MTIRVPPSDLIANDLGGSTPTHNDVATAYADALNPRNAGTDRLETDHQRRLQIDYLEAAERRVQEVEIAGGERLAAIHAIALPLDRRTPAEEARDEMEALHQRVDVELGPYLEEKHLTGQAVEDFNAARGSEPPPEGSFAIYAFPASIPLVLLGICTVFGETLLIGLLLGPFSPGGVAGASRTAVLSSVLFSALASALGIFGLRAFNDPNGVTRWLARATTVACLAAAKLLAMFISAYRIHLQTDQPLTLLSAYHSPEGLLFLLFSLTVFCCTAWKLRGGSKLPWTPVYGEAAVVRAFWLARDALAAVEDHFRSQCQSIYGDKADEARAIMDAEESRFAAEASSARAFNRSAEASARAGAMDRLHFQSRLARYQSAYRTAVAAQTFAEASFPPPVSSGVVESITKALSDARLRLDGGWHGYADHIRQLTEAQAEALASLERRFSALEAEGSATTAARRGASDAQA